MRNSNKRYTPSVKGQMSFCSLNSFSVFCIGSTYFILNLKNELTKLALNSDNSLLTVNEIDICLMCGILSHKMKKILLIYTQELILVRLYKWNHVLTK